MNSENIAKSVHQRLLNVRDKSGENFNSLLIRYGLERFLYRLHESGHGDLFVLKGAMLFALWHDVPGRPTRDMDMLGFGEPGHEGLRHIFADACEVKVVDDGLRFDSGSTKTEDIRDDQERLGIRSRLIGYLDKARIPIQIDVGFGDAIVPPPQSLAYPAILDFPAPRIRAYHPATVVAEKVNAMVRHGFLNSRVKDFYDIHIILTHMHLEDDQIAHAIHATFDRREMALPQAMPVAFTQEFMGDGSKELQWRAFLRRSMLEDFSLSFAETTAHLKSRLWPIIQKASSLE